MENLAYAIILVVGFILGFVVDRAIAKEKAIGRLRIDHSDPYEPTQMFLELKGTTPDMIAKHRVVTFEVVNESYISRN